MQLCLRAIVVFVLLTCLIFYMSPKSGAEEHTCNSPNSMCPAKTNAEALSDVHETDFGERVGVESAAETVHLAVVVCGTRFEETLIMIKSAVTFGRSPFKVHIFAEDGLRESFKQNLSDWKAVISWRSFDFVVYPISFPKGQEEKWRTLFKLCACQRLFIPALLRDVDSVVYVDTDVVFLRGLEVLWRLFGRFNGSQVAAMAPESEDAATNWYTRFARHPFYPPLGVNSGVMLMNLTRMRAFNWQSYLWPLYTKYRLNLTWGDQDIINIIFSIHPESVYVFGCEWNYRPDHCMYMQSCAKAETVGAYIAHGSRSYFHLPNKQRAYVALYDVWKNFQLGDSIEKSLWLPLKDRFQRLKVEYKSDPKSVGHCAKVSHVFLKQLEKQSRTQRTQRNLLNIF